MRQKWQPYPKLPLKRPRAKLAVFSFFLFLSFAPKQSHALWYGGAGFGVGGSGISKSTEVEGVETKVDRSEGPGVLHFYFDKTLSEKWTLGFEHSRGLKFAPVSSGVGFTSAIGRYYFMSPAIDIYQPSEDHIFFQKRWAPYVGGSCGLAFAEVKREDDKVEYLTGSGLHFGIRGGADHHLRPDFGLRYEMSFQYTLMQAAQHPAMLSEFSLWAGFLIPLF